MSPGGNRLRAFVDGRWEVRRGPYGEWLAAVRERVGERVWGLLQDLPCDWADAFLTRCGIVPYHHSTQRVAHDRSIQATGKPQIEVEAETLKTTQDPPMGDLFHGPVGGDEDPLA